MKRRLIEFTCLALFVVLALAPASQATNLSFNATVDNGFYMYLSTNATTDGTQIGFGNNWGFVYSGSASLTPGVINYLHVLGSNWGGPGSLIGDFSLSDADFSFQNGTQKLLTNATDWVASASG